MLNARLSIYTFYNNYLKTKKYTLYERDEITGETKKVKKEMTPAMRLGIFKKPVIWCY